MKNLKEIPTQELDPLIKNLIVLLNSFGYQTEYSCQGDNVDFSYIIFRRQSDARVVFKAFKQVMVELEYQIRTNYWVRLHNFLHPNSVNSSTKTDRVLKWDKTLTYNMAHLVLFEQLLVKHLVNKSQKKLNKAKRAT